MAGDDRRGGFLRPLQRGGDDCDDVALGQRVGHRLGLLISLVGQAESGQPAVQHTLGVVHLAVAHQVDSGLFGHQGLLSLAAAAAAGKASAIRAKAASSSAAETNHASNPLHGG